MAAETWDGTPATFDGVAVDWSIDQSVPGGGVPIRNFTDPNWVARRVKVWTGTAWEWVPLHYWNGTNWV
jgi:hypothetical protein